MLSLRIPLHLLFTNLAGFVRCTTTIDSNDESHRTNWKDVVPYIQLSSSSDGFGEAPGGDSASRSISRIKVEGSSTLENGLASGLPTWGRQYRRVPATSSGESGKAADSGKSESGKGSLEGEDGLRRSKRIRYRRRVKLQVESSDDGAEGEESSNEDLERDAGGEEEDDSEEEEEDHFKESRSRRSPKRKRFGPGRDRWLRQRYLRRQATREEREAKLEKVWLESQMDKVEDPESMAELTFTLEIDGLDKIMLGRQIRCMLQKEERSPLFMKRFEGHRRRLISARRLLFEMHDQGVGEEERGGGGGAIGFTDEDIFEEARKMMHGTKGLRRQRQKPRIMAWSRHRKQQELDDLVEKGLQQHLSNKLGDAVDYRSIPLDHLEPLLRDLVVAGITNPISLFKRIYQLLRKNTKADEEQILQFQERRAKYVEEQRGAR